MRPGDRVTRRGGTMVGTVERVLHGAWSNGGVPMVRVHWDSGSTSRVTESGLVPA